MLVFEKRHLEGIYGRGLEPLTYELLERKEDLFNVEGGYWNWSRKRAMYKIKILNNITPVTKRISRRASEYPLSKSLTSKHLDLESRFDMDDDKERP
jgi:hypothetical protein